MPQFIVALAEDGRTDRDEALRSLTAPAQTCSTETTFVLFSGTFYHTAADGVTFHTYIQIVHAFEVVLEIPGLLENRFRFLGLVSSLAIERADQFAAVPQI